MTPYELHAGDCLEIMRGLPDGFADLTITSPPTGSASTESILQRRPRHGQAPPNQRDT